MNGVCKSATCSSGKLGDNNNCGSCGNKCAINQVCSVASTSNSSPSCVTINNCSNGYSRYFPNRYALNGVWSDADACCNFCGCGCGSSRTTCDYCCKVSKDTCSRQ
jgi:hypothetical protein